MSTQATFAQALLDPSVPCPPGLTTWNGSDPQARFAVYRNNVTVSLIDALAQTFPVVQALVGEDFFRAMAKVFAQNNPPRSRVMAFYGDSFPAFVAGFAPATALPCLADVARLEMARVQAYHAADRAPLHPQALVAAMADGEKLLSLRLHLHPSVQLLDARFAVYSLWAAHQGALCISTVDPDLPEAALVFRSGLDVHTLALAAGEARFLAVLMEGRALPEAVDAAAVTVTKTCTDTASTFDLTRTLAMLLHWQLMTHISTGNTSHEIPC